MFGKSLSDYIAFSKLFLILIPVVALTRLALSLAGLPVSSVRWVSVTAVFWVGVVYYAIRVQRTGFGSYKQLLAIYLLQSFVMEVVITAAIALAIFTGVDNIYSVPEYAFGADGKTWAHAGAHLVVGTIASALVPWAVGSLILFGLIRGQTSKSPNYKPTVGST